MAIKEMNVLLISPEPWGKSKVSKHHYALESAKRGNKVYFLNPNSCSFQLNEESESLFVVDYKELFRGVSFLPKIMQSVYFFLLVKYLEYKVGSRFDVLWNFDSSRLYELSMIKDKLKICHIVDMNQDFHRDQLATSSDICFSTSDFILNELLKHNPKSFKINHGYQSIGNNSNFTFNILNSKLVNVGFVGNLSRKCIDWLLMQELIVNHQSCMFHLVGSYKSIDRDVLSSIKQAKNIVLYGEVDSTQLPSFLCEMDVLLIPYKTENEEDFAQHSNLHKTMEYLGSGNVIVSSYQEEYKDKSGFLEMGRTTKEILFIFDTVVNDLAQYNAIDKQQKRIQLALRNSYAKQVDRIEKYIQDITKE